MRDHITQSSRVKFERAGDRGALALELDESEQVERKISRARSVVLADLLARSASVGTRRDLSARGRGGGECVARSTRDCGMGGHLEGGEQMRTCANSAHPRRRLVVWCRNSHRPLSLGQQNDFGRAHERTSAINERHRRRQGSEESERAREQSESAHSSSERKLSE